MESLKTCYNAYKVFDAENQLALFVASTSFFLGKVFYENLENAL